MIAGAVLVILGLVFLYSGVSGAGQPISYTFCGATPPLACVLSGPQYSTTRTGSSTATTAVTSITSSSQNGVVCTSATTGNPANKYQMGQTVYYNGQAYVIQDIYCGNQASIYGGSYTGNGWNYWVTAGQYLPEQALSTTPPATTTTTSTTSSTTTTTSSTTTTTTTTTTIISSSSTVSPGQTLTITVVSSGSPVPGATVSLVVIPINANPVPPAYAGVTAVLLPSTPSGSTNAQGQFSFVVTQDTQGNIYGYYTPVSGGPVMCCGAVWFYNLYEMTVVSNGVTYGPYDYVNPATSSNWQVDLGGNSLTQQSAVGRLSLLPGSIGGISNNILMAFPLLIFGGFLFIRRGRK